MASCLYRVSIVCLLCVYRVFIMDRVSIIAGAFGLVIIFAEVFVCAGFGVVTLALSLIQHMWMCRVDVLHMWMCHTYGCAMP